MAQKNFVRRNFTNRVNEVIGFTYPKLHEGKTVYVDFFAFDPSVGRMRRKKKHFDHIKNKGQRNRAINHYMVVVSEQLRRGWNPFAETSNRGLSTINLISVRYSDSILQYDRKKTRQSYSSRLNIFNEFLEEQTVQPKYAYQISRELIIDFLDWLIQERGVSNRTRNNYLGWVSSFCEWMRVRGYLTENPAKDIENLRNGEKTRRALSKEELRLVLTHLKKHDKDFLFAVLFAYYTLIRPTELSHLKISDIDIKNRCVYISGNFSKNFKDQTVALNTQLIHLMIENGVFKYSGEHYLFGPGFRPSMERVGPDHFNKRWTQMRKKLKLPKELKFYSLKDSGIRDLANKKGIVVARDQARHTDISTTNKYLQGRDNKGPEAAKDFQMDFEL